MGFETPVFVCIMQTRLRRALLPRNLIVFPLEGEGNNTQNPARRVYKLPLQIVAMRPVYLVLSFSIAIWSTGFPAISAAVRVYTPLEMAAFRMVVGGTIILCLCALSGKRMLPARKDMIPALLCGVIGLAGYNVLLGYGQQHITASESSLMVALTPVFTALAAMIFLGERLALRTGLGIALSFCGIGLMAFSHKEGIGIDMGALLALLAAMTQALLTLLQKRMVQHASPLEVTSYCLIPAMLCLLPLGWTVFPKAMQQPLSEATLSLIYLAVFSLVIGYLGWAYVLKQMSATKAVTFTYCIPIGATLVGYVWLDQVPGVPTAVGGAIALLGVGVVNYRRMRKPEALPPPE